MASAKVGSYPSRPIGPGMLYPLSGGRPRYVGDRHGRRPALMDRERPGRFGAIDSEERTFIDRGTKRLLATLSGRSADRRLVPKADDRPYVGAQVHYQAGGIDVEAVHSSGDEDDVSRLQRVDVRLELVREPCRASGRGSTCSGSLK